MDNCAVDVQVWHDRFVSTNGPSNLRPPDLDVTGELSPVTDDPRPAPSAPYADPAPTPWHAPADRTDPAGWDEAADPNNPAGQTDTPNGPGGFAGRDGADWRAGDAGPDGPGGWDDGAGRADDVGRADGVGGRSGFAGRGAAVGPGGGLGRGGGRGDSVADDDTARWVNSIRPDDSDDWDAFAPPPDSTDADEDVDEYGRARPGAAGIGTDGWAGDPGRAPAAEPPFAGPVDGPAEEFPAGGPVPSPSWDDTGVVENAPGWGGDQWAGAAGRDAAVDGSASGRGDEFGPFRPDAEVNGDRGRGAGDADDVQTGVFPAIGAEPAVGTEGGARRWADPAGEDGAAGWGDTAGTADADRWEETAQRERPAGWDESTDPTAGSADAWHESGTVEMPRRDEPRWNEPPWNETQPGETAHGETGHGEIGHGETGHGEIGRGETGRRDPRWDETEADGPRWDETEADGPRWDQAGRGEFGPDRRDFDARRPVGRADGDHDEDGTGELAAVGSDVPTAGHPHVGPPQVGPPQGGAPHFGQPDSRSADGGASKGGPPDIGLPAEPGGRTIPPRLTSALLAVVTGVGGAAVALGAGYLNVPAFAALIAVVQVVLALAWAVGVQPSNRWGVAVVALVAGLAADGATLGYQRLGADRLSAAVTGATGSDRVDLAPAAGILAVTFVVVILVQLGRWGHRRVRVTEAFGSTMALAGIQVALTTAIALRLNESADVLAFFVAAVGAALVVAHLVDVALPRPAFGAGSERGAIGVAVGVVAAAGAGAGLAFLLGVSVPLGAGLGAVAGLLGALVDVGQAYATVGRRQAGEMLGWSLARPLVGPLLALAVATLAGWTYATVVVT